MNLLKTLKRMLPAPARQAPLRGKVPRAFPAAAAASYLNRPAPRPAGPVRGLAPRPRPLTAHSASYLNAVAGQQNPQPMNPQFAYNNPQLGGVGVPQQASRYPAQPAFAYDLQAQPSYLNIQ